MVHKSMQILKILVLGVWLSLALSSTGSIGPAMSAQPQDDISNLRVKESSASEIEVTVDYAYGSDHGDKVMLSAVPLSLGSELPFFSSTSVTVAKGSSGTATVKITYGQNNPPERLTTDQIRVFLQDQEGKRFFAKEFDYTKNWQLVQRPNQSPIASFTFSPSNPRVGETVTFDASSSRDPDGIISRYEWDFGDGSTGSGRIATHIYRAPSSYTVTLRVTDDRGASNSTSRTVSVQEIVAVRILAGHINSVTSVTFNPDGRLLASGSWQEIKLWEVATGREVRTLTGHTERVWSVAFSPDGRWLASGSGDKTIKLWDVATGREMRTLASHTEGVASIAFSPDGRLLASGSWDWTIKLWEVATGQQVRTLPGHTEGIHSVAFSPDGRLLASGSRDRTIRLWDISDLTQASSGAINVPRDFPTIQAAIDAAHDGDSIVVSEGLYRESLIISKSITLRAAGRAEIVGTDSLPLIHISNASDVVIEGFVIRGGGTGIAIISGTTVGTSALIRNNVIQNHQRDGIYLGGVRGIAPKATIVGNTISGNENGIRIFWMGSAEVSNNSIMSNRRCGIAVEGSPFITGSENELFGNGQDLCGTPQGGWPPGFKK